MATRLPKGQIEPRLQIDGERLFQGLLQVLSGLPDEVLIALRAALARAANAPKVEASASPAPARRRKRRA